MAASPSYKVYDADGNYTASVKDIIHGLVLTSFIGKGAQLRWGHSKKNVLWHEGFEDRAGDECYDINYEVVMYRRDAVFTANKKSYDEHLEKIKKPHAMAGTANEYEIGES